MAGFRISFNYWGYTDDGRNVSGGVIAESKSEAKEKVINETGSSLKNINIEADAEMNI